MRLLDRHFDEAFARLPQGCAAVDLGFGDAPLTTVELRARLPLSAVPEVIGVELSEERAQSAQAHAQPGLRFAQGSFDLASLQPEHPLGLVRACNVLRGYPIDAVASAQAQMLRALCEGGLLIEGSTDVDGHLCAAHLWRRTQQRARYVGLLISTDFERGFAPRMFRDVLPRDLRRDYRPGEGAFELLETWQAEFQVVSQQDPMLSPEKRFEDSCSRLAARGCPLLDAPGLWAGGTLLWTPEQPSERPLVLKSGTLLSEP